MATAEDDHYSPVPELVTPRGLNTSSSSGSSLGPSQLTTSTTSAIPPITTPTVAEGTDDDEELLAQLKKSLSRLDNMNEQSRMRLLSALKASLHASPRDAPLQQHHHPHAMYSSVECPFTSLTSSSSTTTTLSSSTLTCSVVTEPSSFITDLKLGEKIGEGSFGSVYKCTWSGSVVAAKTCKARDDSEGADELAAEARLLTRLKHPNCVSYYGLWKNPMDPCNNVFIVTEYMQRGSLETWLRKLPPSTTLLPLTQEQFLALVGFVRDAAAGMCYLESVSLIHRDLAARNILLKEEEGRLVAKVSDFGLSRMLASDQQIYHSQSSVLPIKWSAPEAITQHKFSHQSDVWSFGVLVWEIFSRGSVPYPELSNREVLSFLQSGGRLSRPIDCPESLFAMLLECWNDMPQERPKFKDILGRLTEFCDTANHLFSSALDLAHKMTAVKEASSSSTHSTNSSPSNTLDDIADTQGSILSYSSMAITSTSSSASANTSTTNSNGSTSAAAAGTAAAGAALQAVYERCVRQSNAASNVLELAVALVCLNDYLSAYDEITRFFDRNAIERRSLDTTTTVSFSVLRGYINMGLGDFCEAQSDYVKAVQLMTVNGIRSVVFPKSIPPAAKQQSQQQQQRDDSKSNDFPDTISLLKVQESAGKATLCVAAIKDNKTDFERSVLHDQAISIFTAIIADNPGCSPSNAFNLGQALFLRSLYDNNRMQLVLAMKHFEVVLLTKHTVLEPEAHYWRAKCVALLGDKEMANNSLILARRLNPYLPAIDLSSKEELRAMPAVPSDRGLGTKSQHQWEELAWPLFTKWCDYCLKNAGCTYKRHSKEGRGYKCKSCGYIVDTVCFSVVQHTNCVVRLGKQYRKSTDAPQHLVLPSHIHRLREGQLHKLRACSLCAGIISALPCPKRAMQCVSCRARFHPECVPLMPTTAITLITRVEDEIPKLLHSSSSSSALTAVPPPPSLPTLSSLKSQSVFNIAPPQPL